MRNRQARYLAWARLAAQVNISIQGKRVSKCVRCSGHDARQRGSMKRMRREWGMVFLGLAVGFMLGEVKQVFQPNHVVAWALALLTLACLLLSFFLIRGKNQNPGAGK